MTQLNSVGNSGGTFATKHQCSESFWRKITIRHSKVMFECTSNICFHPFSVIKCNIYSFIFACKLQSEWILAHDDTNKYVSTLKWDALAACESFPAWLPAGYSFLRPSEISNSYQGRSLISQTCCQSTDVNLPLSSVPSTQPRPPFLCSCS